MWRRILRGNRGSERFSAIFQEPLPPFGGKWTKTAQSGAGIEE